MANTRASAPQLLFDDGSRVIAENSSAEALVSPRGNASIEDYCELKRLVTDELSHAAGFQRVALQFPNELLVDAPQVVWYLERHFPERLFFVLGDATPSCCPDVVGAAHLQADCLVHFGHACLTTTSTTSSSVPVLHHFGTNEIDIPTCVETIVGAVTNNERRLLLLYDVEYQWAMEALQTDLAEQGDLLVVAGQLPDHCECEKTATQSMIIGGLQLPNDLDYSSYTLLYIGDANGRPFLNAVLRFLDKEMGIWTYNPRTKILQTELDATIRRKLNRRFFLVQKAKQANTFGIVVATFDERVQTIVSTLRRVIQDSGRSLYSFCVGKINPAKLANFSEIDCFVLVACAEHAWLDDESEYPTPVVTPLEVSMALGMTEWGSYSLDTRSFLESVEKHVPATTNSEDDDDAPFFSLVSGQFVSSTAKQAVDLTALPGQGQLMKHQSAASDFLRQREYQGLQVQAGETEVKPAVEGQEGIASNYGDR